MLHRLLAIRRGWAGSFESRIARVLVALNGALGKPA